MKIYSPVNSTWFDETYFRSIVQFGGNSNSRKIMPGT
jgi:hypothetical protein